jgi:hypothetical protein
MATWWCAAVSFVMTIADKKLIASAIVDPNNIDREALLIAGFKLDGRFPSYVQPIKGTFIWTTPLEDGRLYEQYED